MHHRRMFTIMAVGLGLRALTRWAQARRPKPSLLRQAIVEQLPPDAWARPRLLLATAGSDDLAEAWLVADIYRRAARRVFATTAWRVSA